MHEPKASALRNLDRYYILRVHHIKTRSPFKCIINILLMITHLQPITYLRSTVAIPILTGFDWSTSSDSAVWNV